VLQRQPVNPGHRSRFRPATPLAGRKRRTGTGLYRDSDRGAAAVEAAIILPVLLLLIFGLIDFGRMLNAQITVTSSAREGARAESLHGDAEARAKAAADALPVVVTREKVCPSPADLTRDAEVRVAYTFTFVTPVGSLAALFGGNGASGNLTLVGRSVMPCQQ
jgi:hypothetical protein